MDITRNAESVKRDFFPKLKRVLASLPFAEDVVAAYYCAFDKDTPVKARAILLGALAYFILPIDAIPDFIAGLGFTDDMAVLFAAFSVIRSHLKPIHHEMARETLDRLRSGEPVSA